MKLLPLIQERQYNMDLERTFDIYGETGDISVIIDYLSKNNIPPSKLHSNCTIYRGMALNGTKCDQRLPNWEQPESILISDKPQSWTRSITVAKRYFTELADTYQNGALYFLLKYTTTPEDEVYDMNKFKEYRLSRYGWEKEVKCRPTGKVEIIGRKLPFVEDYVNGKIGDGEIMIRRYDLPKDYWAKLKPLLTGQKRRENKEGQIKYGSIIANNIW